MNAPQRTAMAAGWLFVDLILVLFLVQLGSSGLTPVRPAADPSATDAASQTAAPAPPTVSDPQPARSLDPQSRSIEIIGFHDPDGLIRRDGRVLDELRARIVSEGTAFTGRVAAMVLVFGSYGGCQGCTPTNGSSVAFAKAAIPLFPSALPAIFPSSTDFYRDYLDTGLPPGSIRAEIFFFTG